MLVWVLAGNLVRTGECQEVFLTAYLVIPPRYCPVGKLVCEQEHFACSLTDGKRLWKNLSKHLIGFQLVTNIILVDTTHPHWKIASQNSPTASLCALLSWDTSSVDLFLGTTWGDLANCHLVSVARPTSNVLLCVLHRFWSIQIIFYSQVFFMTNTWQKKAIYNCSWKQLKEKAKALTLLTVLVCCLDQWLAR